MIRAVLWDFGGVILTSPFEAFAAYERQLGLPEGFIRRVNTVNPDGNAWARMERNELDVDGFATAFEAEARDLGGELDGGQIVGLLAGAVRPEMVEALRRLRGGYRLACRTNNVAHGGGDRRPAVVEGLELFDVVVESSKVGVRKPERRFYELACEQLGVEPSECVFLDDLGVNLKPARQMGMTTIKVEDPELALAELERVLGLALR